jgi:hypothetical protein
MKIFNWELSTGRRATDSDVRANLLLAAVRAFREAEEISRKAGSARREHATIAEFAEPVVVPLPLLGRGS